MKNLLASFIAFAFFFVGNAWSHPLDTDPASTIDAGATITAERDLNLPANLMLFLQNGGLLRFDASFSVKDAYCALAAFNANQEAFNRDLVIAKGSVFTLVSNELKSSDHEKGGDFAFYNRFKFGTPGGNSLVLECLSSGSWASYRVPLVGDVRRSIERAFALKFAEPVQLN